MSEGLSTVESPEFSCPSKACEARFDSGSLRERPRRRCAVPARQRGDTNFLKNLNIGRKFCAKSGIIIITAGDTQITKGEQHMKPGIGMQYEL